jgi:alpha-methylacyl-CoA racemase
MRAVLSARIASRSRDEWAAVFDGTDACAAPVLTMSEAVQHPHAQARTAYVDLDGAVQPAPAPRFERTPSGIPAPPSTGEPTGIDSVLQRWNSSAIQQAKG